MGPQQNECKFFRQVFLALLKTAEDQATRCTVTPTAATLRRSRNPGGRQGCAGLDGHAQNQLSTLLRAGMPPACTTVPSTTTPGVAMMP